MENVNRYRTIRNSYHRELDDEIDIRLRDGWTLYGSPYLDKEGHYCQALVEILQSPRLYVQIVEDSSIKIIEDKT